MSKYIDADKLSKAIEEKGLDCSFALKMERLDTLALIDELKQEQPSEDLEVRKQIEELANDWHHKGFASDEDCPLCMQDLIDILWYFYELGLKAKEDEQ